MAWNYIGLPTKINVVANQISRHHRSNDHRCHLSELTPQPIGTTYTGITHLVHIDGDWTISLTNGSKAAPISCDFIVLNIWPYMWPVREAKGLGPIQDQENYINDLLGNRLTRGISFLEKHANTKTQRPLEPGKLLQLSIRESGKSSFSDQNSSKLH